jgi:hypothetical protein
MTALGKLDSPKTIWVLLAELAKQQNNLGSHGTSESARRMRMLIKSRYTPVQRELLENAKDSDLDFPSGMYLHLPPDKKGCHPVLKVSFDTKDEHTVFRVKAAILVEHEEEIEGVPKMVHRGIGVRFESREGPQGKSNHDYAHAQWFSSFQKGTDTLPGCPPWLPDVHPAIPIPAHNAVGILCCALKSFYGSESEPLSWLAKIVNTRENLHTLGTETRDEVKLWVKTI